MHYHESAHNPPLGPTPDVSETLYFINRHSEKMNFRKYKKGILDVLLLKPSIRVARIMELLLCPWGEKAFVNRKFDVVLECI